MERDGDNQINGHSSSPSSTLLLEHFGEVILSFNSDGLSWKKVDSSSNNFSSFRLQVINLYFKAVSVTDIKFSDIYATEFINRGIIQGPVRPNGGKYEINRYFEMYRFTVHGFKRSWTKPCVWNLASYTFGHKDRQVCETWVNRITDYLSLDELRPKNLMVFVNPRSGKGNACDIWKSLAPIFSRAKVKTKVIVTEWPGQAFDVMESISNNELNLYDGVIAVGGDGFFNEILNGFLKSRHKIPYPSVPSDFVHTVGYNGSSIVEKTNEKTAETSHNDDRSSPLPCTRNNGNGDASCSKEQDPEFHIPNERFRFGIIPAGSTDAVVICTTGARDPVTSALHIVLGKRVSMDLAQVVRWKLTPSSKVEPFVRYAASFAGYGFYGDVIAESEESRWMGPIRYDYAGTLVFLKHRSYEADISYLEVDSEEKTSSSEVTCSPSTSKRTVCRVNCNVCNTNPSHTNGKKWTKARGRYLSIGAAIISCRNEKAPDGLVAEAHLSDGLLHLILIKDCLGVSYLWHLIQLARKGGKPLDFKFVEHHKTPAFTFTSVGTESVWNLDGEIFQAHQLSAQVFRGLISLFATGPEV